MESGKHKIGTKPKRKGISLSAATAALKEPVDDSDDDNDDNMETDGDGPLWQLFDQLYNTANASGELYVKIPQVIVIYLCTFSFILIQVLLSFYSFFMAIIHLGQFIHLL